ncbi:MAG: peptidylprolyl isomerase [Sandaracinaceae bacterium]
MPREKEIKVSSGDVVALAFVLRDAEGNVLTEVAPTDPLVLLHGQGFAIAPIDSALDGKEAGDRFELSLEEGVFGEAVTNGERVVPRDRFPPGPLPSGTAVSVMDADASRTVWVLRESGAHVVVSLSHPWASATRIEAEVVSVRAATAEEREAGFATDVAAAEGAPTDDCDQDDSDQDDSDKDERSEEERSEEE